MSVHQNVIRFIQEKNNTRHINLNDMLLNHIKSFDFIILIIELEQKLNIKLPFEQAVTEHLFKINNFIQWVEKHYEHTHNS